MENEAYNQEEVQVEQKSSLHQVTSLSKYLAMVLFIVLPFLGGWIGYIYSPEKTVEVEKVVVEEAGNELITFLSQNPRGYAKVVGQTSDGLIIEVLDEKGDNGQMVFFNFETQDFERLGLNYDGIGDVQQRPSFNGVDIFVFGETKDLGLGQGSFGGHPYFVKHSVSKTGTSTEILHTLADDETLCGNYYDVNSLGCAYGYQEETTYHLEVFSKDTGERIKTLKLETGDFVNEPVLTE